MKKLEKFNSVKLEKEMMQNLTGGETLTCKVECWEETYIKNCGSDRETTVIRDYSTGRSTESITLTCETCH
jgi:hypothetical protein